MTTSLDDRIARFENMAEADPDNDMAHFSLGNAYLQAGRAAEAGRSLLRCLELNPDMSKAYQLAGQAMIQAGWEDKAAAMLKSGYEVAAMAPFSLLVSAATSVAQSAGGRVELHSIRTAALPPPGTGRFPPASRRSGCGISGALR